MKFNNLSTLFICFSFFIHGCAITSTADTSSIGFNYKTEDPENNGIVQVFDIEDETAIQIRNLASKAPIFVDESNNRLKFRLVGEMVILNGIYEKFNVVSIDGVSRVIRIGAKNERIRVRNSGELGDYSDEVNRANILKNAEPASRTSKVIIGEEVRDLIVKLQNEISFIKKCMANDSCDPGSLGKNVNQQDVNENEIKNNLFNKKFQTIRVSFSNNSDDFRPIPEVQHMLLEMARGATRIKVKGFTDGAISNFLSTSLAKKRAISAQRFLLKNGISSEKIDVDYVSAGGFIADNSTKAGRDENRRVEIEIL